MQPLQYRLTSLRRNRSPRHPLLPSCSKNIVRKMVRPKPGISPTLIRWRVSMAVSSSAARAMASSSMCPTRRSSGSIPLTKRGLYPASTPRCGGQGDSGPGARRAWRSTHLADRSRATLRKRCVTVASNDGTCSTRHAGHPLEACGLPHTGEGEGCGLSKRKRRPLVGTCERVKRPCDHEERRSFGRALADVSIRGTSGREG